MQYHLVTSGTFSNLQERVQELIEAGWVPQGGPVVAPTIPMQIAQAMIKVKKLNISSHITGANK